MSRKKLLLADDSPTIQKVVSLTFADKGFEVSGFLDGTSAFEQLAEIRPDVVLADVNIPGLSGYEFCERIRLDEATKNIPVILLVGSFEPFDREEAVRVGANGHMTKPFTSIADLISTVDDLLVNNDTAELPDTSDIDHLYGQSISADADAVHEQADSFGDEGIDDEMIQTSYAAREGEELSDEAYFVPVSDSGSQPDSIGDPDAPISDEAYFAAAPDVEPEQESVEEYEAPISDEAYFAPVPEEQQLQEESVEEAVSTSIDPAASGSHEDDADLHDTADLPTADPFESVAQPTEEYEDASLEDTEDAAFEPEPEAVAEDLATAAKEASFGDILEIPGVPASLMSITTQEAASLTGGRELVSLAPELIDDIVEKVLKRLADK